MVFFFKQKTAYEMRISDWSSDVCSSDLMDLGAGVTGNQADNPLDLCGIVACAGIYAALAQSVEPQRAVGVDHDFDDGGVGKRRGDGRSHPGAQHPAAAVCGHRFPHGRTSYPFGPGAPDLLWPLGSPPP